MGLLVDSFHSSSKASHFHMASTIIVFLYILDICVLQQGAVLFFLET